MKIFQFNVQKSKSNIGISLGWNCYSAMFGAKEKLRGRKANGYKTGPFDIGITNYPGIVRCIREDFKYFMAPSELTLVKIPKDALWNKNDILIFNKRYGFIFPHESPGHGNLYKTQKWPGGINHFIDNNFEKLIERYNNRANNFKNYLKSGHPINFIITHFIYDFSDLENVLKEKYPGLKFNIIRLELENSEATKYSHFSEHMKWMVEDRYPKYYYDVVKFFRSNLGISI